MKKHTHPIKSMEGMVFDIFGIELPHKLSTEFRQDFSKALAQWASEECAERDARILIGYYGLDGPSRTLHEMAESKCRHSRVGALRVRAIKRLRSMRYSTILIDTLGRLMDTAQVPQNHQSRKLLTDYCIARTVWVGASRTLLRDALESVPPERAPCCPLVRMHELGLHQRTRNRLYCAGIVRSVELYVLSEKAFLLLPKIGVRSFREVQDAWAQHGIRWPVCE